LLARREAVIIHASSIVEDGKALVFIGHSGAGKSTISAIAESVRMNVLSDDRTILALRDGTVFAAGTPWHGSQLSGRPESVPVAAIFLLEQADEDRAIAMEPSRAFAEVIVRSVRPLANVGEQVMVLDTVETIVGAVRSGVLRFMPTSAALGAARDFVAA
jgi:ABC-type glutathione transport system ATPase component